MPARNGSPQTRIVLASQSPRRLALLRSVGYEPIVAVAAIDEERLTHAMLGASHGSITHEQAAALTLELARAKAAAVCPEHPDAIVIGSDTLVRLAGRILGKPADAAEATAMLRDLSGRTHTVHTAVAIYWPESANAPTNRTDAGRSCTPIHSATEVDFLPLDPVQERLIARYVAAGHAADKAGAYGIQDSGSLFVAGLRGDYGTVVGLPLAAVVHSLMEAGYD